MEALQRFAAILMADVRERTRSPRFWLVLAAMAYVTWWCFPAREAGYSTVSLLDHSRGEYTSAWVGMVVGLMYSTMLGLAGFYVVRGTLTRDIETRVWQLLVTTPMTRATYLLAKWASHMAVFALIALVGAGVALAAQWLRAEDHTIDLVELFKPLLWLTLPSLALTAMFAVWFDLFPWLRRTAGSVVFFILWLFITSVSVAPYDDRSREQEMAAWSSDPGGMLVGAREFIRVREAQTGKPLEYGMNLGSNAHAGPIDTFPWREWNIRPMEAVGRLLWLLAALIGTLAMAPLLDWAAARGVSAAKRRNGGGGRGLRWLNLLLDPFARGPLGILIVAELKLVLRQRALWWWLAALILLGVQALAPMKAVPVALLLAWLLPLDVLARSVLRERDQGTAGLVFTAPKIFTRLLATRFLVGALMLSVLSLPGLLRLSIDAPAIALASAVCIVSIASWGPCLGALCRSALPFELLMVVSTYIGLQGAAPLNIAQQPQAVALWHALALLPAWALLAWAWPRLARR